MSSPLGDEMTGKDVVGFLDDDRRHASGDVGGVHGPGGSVSVELTTDVSHLRLHHHDAAQILDLGAQFHFRAHRFEALVDADRRRDDGEADHDSGNDSQGHIALLCHA